MVRRFKGWHARGRQPCRNAMTDCSRRRVLIVGGGASGTLTALRLLQSKTEELQVTIVERAKSQFGRGIAFREDSGDLPLNVRASGMSLYDERPGHFVDWLSDRRSQYAATSGGVSPSAFMPRRIFGDYMIAEVNRSARESVHGLAVVTDEVVGLRSHGDTIDVQLQNGGTREADRVVLALGNAPCASSLGESGSWSRTWTGSLEGSEKLIFIGAGLTTVDHLISLQARGHRGPLLVISRHGRWPCTHTLESRVELDHAALRGRACSPRSLVAHLRDHLGRHSDVSGSQLIDGIRPHASAIWQQWSRRDQRQFMEHLRHFWDIQRHRIPQESAALIDQMTASGQLRLVAGRIRQVSQEPAGTWRAEFFPRGCHELRVETAQRVVRCTGPDCNYSRLRSPLVAGLRESGWIVPDPLGLGIESDPHGRVIAAGRAAPVDTLFTLGPMRRGSLWESTSVPEIRVQACELASRLVESLDKRCCVR